MTPLDSSEIAARRRPGAILLLWGVRLVGAWLVAAPVASIVGSALHHLPGGDAALFEPGGAVLLEVLRLHQTQLIAAAATGAWTLLLVGAVCLVPLCGLMVALAHGGRLRPGDWAAQTMRHVPAYVLLAGLSALAQTAVGTTLALIAIGSRDSLMLQLGVRGADVAMVVLAGLATAVVVGLGIVHDLARAAAVRNDLGVGMALRVAASVAARHPLRVAVDWLNPAVWTLVVVVAAAVLVRGLSVEAAGEWRLGAALVVHQLAALAMVGLRAVWLARALRRVGRSTAEATAPSIELAEATLSP